MVLFLFDFTIDSASILLLFAIFLYSSIVIYINRMGDNQTSDTKILIIAGPSGSGKNSILEGLLQQCSNCVRLVTATTRSPRAGEQDGVDYYFLTKTDFLKGIDSGQIPEYWHAKDTDRYYGTYLPGLNAKMIEDKVVVAQVQAEGIKFFKEHFNTIAIMITADSEEELIGRITARHPMTKNEIDERMGLVQKEVQELGQICDYTVRNPNGKLNQVITEIITILKKENYVK